MLPEDNIIDHEATSHPVNLGDLGFSPMELEALGKAARTMQQLNEILADDPDSSLAIDWNGIKDGKAVTWMSTDGKVRFE